MVLKSKYPESQTTTVGALRLRRITVPYQDKPRPIVSSLVGSSRSLLLLVHAVTPDNFIGLIVHTPVLQINNVLVGTVFTGAGEAVRRRERFYPGPPSRGGPHSLRSPASPKTHHRRCHHT